jgi:short-subunit dehydrogenase
MTFSKSLESVFGSSPFKIAGIVGSMLIIRKAIQILIWSKKYFLSFKRDYTKEYGDGWVVITGGSDGIGKGLAIEFAKQGLKVLVIARDEQKLKSAVEEIKKHSIKQVEYLSYDFSKLNGELDVQELQNKLKDYEDVSILINNVGMTQNEHFHNLSNDYVRKMINVNVNATVWMTKIFIEKMKYRKKSLIVGSGSVGYLIRPAYKSIYVGSKSFMEAFLYSLSREHSNIDFSYLEIGAVTTHLNKNKLPYTVNSPEEFAQNALKHLGKYFHTACHYKHAFFQDFILFFFLNSYRQNIEKEIKKNLENQKFLHN